MLVTVKFVAKMLVEHNRKKAKIFNVFIILFFCSFVAYGSAQSTDSQVTERSVALACRRVEGTVIFFYLTTLISTTPTTLSSPSILIIYTPAFKPNSTELNSSTLSSVLPEYKVLTTRP